MVDWQRVITLSESMGAPGAEESVRAVMARAMCPYVKELLRDRLGGVVGLRCGDARGPKVLMIAHLDEVALMITEITPTGFLRFQTLGGWDPAVLGAQRFHILTRTGSLLAVIGSTPPHLQAGEASPAPALHRLFLDVGATSEEEVRAWGIRCGDVAVPASTCARLGKGNRWIAKAWDNRIGCALILEVLASLQGHPNRLYAGATVQEEVGLRGAQVMAQKIRPDVVLAVDVGPAGDMPGVAHKPGELGRGAAIRFFDRATIVPARLYDFLVSVAEEEKIPYQLFHSQGGTDTGSAHRVGLGAPAATIGVVSRYIHSHGSVVDQQDIEAAARLLRAVVQRLDRTVYQDLLPS